MNPAGLREIDLYYRICVYVLWCDTLIDIDNNGHGFVVLMKTTYIRNTN